MESELLVGLLSELPTSSKEDPEELPRHGGSTPPTLLVPVLDAIANISVSRPRGEVIAAALQQDNENQRIIITLASDDTVAPSTQQHIRAVWGALVNIAEAYRTQRLQSNGPLAVSELKRPPEIPSAELPHGLEESILEFKRRIYAFTWKKLNQRLRKPFKNSNRLAEFFKFVGSLPHQTDPPNSRAKTTPKHQRRLGLVVQKCAQRQCQRQPQNRRYPPFFNMHASHPETG